MISYGLGALLYAPLTRFLSYRLVMMAALMIYAAASLISGLSHSLNQLLIAQLMAGVTAASSTPLSLMLIGEFFDKQVRGRLVGIYFGCSFVASIVGMIFMGLAPWRYLFYIPAALGIFTCVSLIVINNDLMNRNHNASINYFKIFTDDSTRKVFLFIFMMSFLYHGVHKWYGIYLHQEYHLSKETISLFLIISALCGLLGQNIGGYLSDKKGRRITCLIGGLILAVGTISLSGHYVPYVMPLLIGSMTIGWTINHNAISTILTDFPDENRPIMASLNSSVRFVSGGLGFSITSFFVSKSFSLTFLAIGLLLLGLSFAQKIFISCKT